jgi:hypothetical protein
MQCDTVHKNIFQYQTNLIKSLEMIKILFINLNVLYITTQRNDRGPIFLCTYRASEVLIKSLLYGIYRHMNLTQTRNA